MFNELLNGSITGNLLLAFKYLVLTAPFWLPVALAIGLFNAWVSYKREKYWQGLGGVVLEVKLPQEVFKSPAAMEIIFSAMHQTADESGWYWKYWRGQTRGWFSLELVSNGGEIHFYIWMRNKYKTSIENHIYSQYPEAEVRTVDDYATSISYDPNLHSMWCSDWSLTEPDPVPIKTYVDYGLDKDPKEEFKVDPLSSMLEFLGSITAGQNVYFQFIIRAHKKEATRGLPWAKKLEKFAWSETYDPWKDEAKKMAQEIVDKAKEDKRFMTQEEQDTVSALGRSTSKFAFDVGIRTMYISEKDKPNLIGGIIGSFKQFGSPGSNGFAPDGWSGYFNRPWKSWFGRNEAKVRPIFIEEYKRRRYFFSPYRHKYFYTKPFVLNSEELATIYHFPGATVATPNLKRIPSKKAQAPTNLPI